jgi:SAM-dependent methyltransferase
MIDETLELAEATITRVTCPCCGGWSLEPFEDTFDIHGNIVAMHICLVCSAIVNRSSLERIRAAPDTLRGAQTDRLSMVYPVGNDFGDMLKKEVEIHTANLDLFRTRAIPNVDPRQLIVAEIGIGRGTLLRSAAALFGRRYGVDLAFGLFHETVDYLHVPENVVLLESIAHAPEPLDVVVAWHSFEHVLRLHELVATIRGALKPGGWLFFQVPLYRPDYVVESHYTFLNQRAVAVIAEIERFGVVEMWTDYANAFLTALLQKYDD